MRCPICDHDNREDSTFCEVCGSKLTNAHNANSSYVKQDDSKKKMFIIIGIIAAAAAVVLIVVLLNVGKKNDTASAKVNSDLNKIKEEIIVPEIMDEDIIKDTDESSILEAEASEELKKDSPEKPEVKSPTPTSKPKPTLTPAPQAQPAARDFIIPNSNTQYLSEADLAGLSEWEIRIARNEIYARHGRKFKDSSLQEYFNSCSWYNGTIEPGSFNDNVLNEYEIANRDLIVKYEEVHGLNQSVSTPGGNTSMPDGVYQAYGNYPDFYNKDALIYDVSVEGDYIIVTESLAYNISDKYIYSNYELLPDSEYRFLTDANTVYIVGEYERTRGEFVERMNSDIWTAPGNILYVKNGVVEKIMMTS